MRPTSKLFLFALIIFLLFGTVPVAHAFDLASVTVTPATCNGPVVDGMLEASEEADYYSIVLVAGQKFVVDVNTVDQGETLDTILEVYVHPDTETIIALNDRSSEDPIDEDPYIAMPVDADGTYYLRIYDSTLGGIAGAYTLTLECSDQPSASEFTWPVEVGDLIGSTGTDNGSFINITPENAESSLPFPLGVGPITDIEFDPISDLVFVAVGAAVALDAAVAVDAAVALDHIPGRIVTIDSHSGNEVNSYSTVKKLVVALEAAEEELYGIQVDPDTEVYSLVLVTFDDSDPADPTTTLTPVFLFDKQEVRALTYHSVEKVIYGVAPIASKSDLIKIHLEPELSVETASAVPIVDGLGQPVYVVSLDFSHDNVLFGVDLTGNLYEIDHTTGLAKLMGDIDVLAEVSGLTFVVGVPPDVEPIKTICSSTLTTSLASASSGTVDPKLSRFKLKKNPLHRAIGLFKFEGMQGETVTLNVDLEVTESATAVAEESSASELENSWLNHWQGKGRVFLGIRDAISGLDYRERVKDHIPFSMSATLPESGTYYVMLIRPLLRFHQTDYCLTLESDMLDSQAWETFDVAWPHDESDNGSTTTLDEAKVGETQNFDAVVSSSAATEPESGTTVTNEPAVESDTQVVQTEVGDETPVVEPVAETPVVTEPATDGGDTEVVQTDVGDETPVVEPVAETPVAPEPVADGGDDAEVMQTTAGDISVEEVIVEVPAVQESTNDIGNVETQPADDAVSGGETPEDSAPASDTTVEEPVVDTVDEPVVETPVETDPAAEIGSETESVDDDISDAVGDDAPADEEYSDEPMEDPLPMKE